MNKKIGSIILFVMGLGVFIAAFIVVNPLPMLRTTEDLAINASYTPLPHAGFAVVDLREVPTGKAHVRRNCTNTAKVSSAESTENVLAGSDPMNGLGLGQFSTQSARDFHAIRYQDTVPPEQHAKR